MEELTEVKEEFRKEELQKKHELGLVCPICNITHVRIFVTNKDISKENLEKFIVGEKQDFHSKHILNCKGVSGNSP